MRKILVDDKMCIRDSLGRGDQKTAAGFAQAALQLTILFSLLVTLISMLFTNPLLQFFALNDAETYNSARIYMRITCGLILFSFLSQVLTGLFTAQGDSKTPLKANFFGLILNMILDPLLVLGVGPFPRFCLLYTSSIILSMLWPVNWKYCSMDNPCCCILLEKSSII